MSVLLTRRLRDIHGQTLVEFALVSFLLLTTILGVVEISRMVLVYTSIANAARTGARYAIVHGSYASTSSGPSDNPASVVTVVKNFAGAGALNTANFTATCTASSAPSGSICIHYPNTTNTPGSLVKVTVAYRYDPLMRYLPLSINLTSTSEGVITF